MSKPETFGMTLVVNLSYLDSKRYTAFACAYSGRSSSGGFGEFE